MNASAAGESERSRCQAMLVTRGGNPSRSSATRSSRGETARLGMRAAPSPAATIPWTISLSSDRNTTRGSAPVDLKLARANSVLRQSRKQINGRVATSSSMSDSVVEANGESVRTTSTYWSRKRSIQPNGPGAVGSTTNASSSSPRSSNPNSSTSPTVSVSMTSTDEAETNSVRIRGNRCALTL
jgi:hypothetical protein